MSTALSPGRPLPATATVLQRWRFRRNLVIYAAHRAGFTQRDLADVFDLPQSQISTIVKRLSLAVVRTMGNE